MSARPVGLFSAVVRAIAHALSLGRLLAARRSRPARRSGGRRSSSMPRGWTTAPFGTAPLVNSARSPTHRRDDARLREASYLWCPKPVALAVLGGQ